MDSHKKALVEAILFLEGDEVTVASLSAGAGIDEPVCRTILDSIESDLGSEDRGLALARRGDFVRLVPKPELSVHLVTRYGKKGQGKLSKSTLETLAIVAYSQPVTRAEVESLRGVSVDRAMRQLVDWDLVKELGKKDAPGRPMQYGTTREFLRRFQLSSIAELPRLSESDAARFDEQ